jgi:hypothetical protein
MFRVLLTQFFVMKKLIVVLTVAHLKFCCLVAYKLQVAQSFVQFFFCRRDKQIALYFVVCFMPLTVSQTIHQG